jgi:hypothetical protein
VETPKAMESGGCCPTGWDVIMVTFNHLNKKLVSGNPSVMRTPQ